MQRWFEKHVGVVLTRKMEHSVQTSVQSFYHSCWGDYCDLLHRKKLDLSSRLRDEYNTNLKGIKAKINEIRSTNSSQFSNLSEVNEDESFLDDSV